MRRFNRGEHLFHQGDTDRGVHRILAGIVTVYRLTADGYRQIEAFAGPGDYVSLCLSSTSPTSAEALSAVSTAFMSRRAFETRLLEDTAFRAKVFAEIDRATAEVRRQATQLACRSASQRVADFVIFMAHRF
ncbi:MAG: Crp/Fnr family transcriptional regulator, partial [Pseudomonadota bacterium]